jgi:hypothetical protein
MSNELAKKIEQCVFCPSTDISVRFLGAVNVGICERCVNGLIEERLRLMDRWPVVGAKA